MSLWMARCLSLYVVGHQWISLSIYIYMYIHVYCNVTVAISCKQASGQHGVPNLGGERFELDPPRLNLDSLFGCRDQGRQHFGQQRDGLHIHRCCMFNADTVATASAPSSVMYACCLPLTIRAIHHYPEAGQGIIRRRPQRVVVLIRTNLLFIGCSLVDYYFLKYY